MGQADTDIVLFGDFLASGGVERSFANVIPEWARAGYRVEIVGHRSAVCFYPHEVREHARFTHLGTRAKLLTVIALWRHLRQRRPRAVLATGHISNLVLALAACLPRARGMRCYLNVQNDFVASGKDKTGLKRNRKLRQVRRWYPRADALLVTSHALRRNLVAAAGVRNLPIRVVYSGVITPQLMARAVAPVPHPWLAADRDRPVIIGAGRLKAQKDFATLVRAFAGVLDRRGARLILIGEGEERAGLEALVAELGVGHAVDLPGFTDNPYAWIARADVFALSSRWEGFGNVVAEALALGVPVVSTSCPSGPAEILGAGAHGRLVPVADYEALANAVVETIEHGNRCGAPEQASGPFTAAYAAPAYLEALGLEPASPAGSAP